MGNMKYGCPDESGKLKYAPWLVNNKANASEAEYNAAGYYRVNGGYMPTAPDGKIAVGTGRWKVEDGECRHEFNFIDAPSDDEDVEPDVETPDMDEYDGVMERHLKLEREARGYTTREPSEYVGSSIPRWAQDARDWIAHRDAVMVYALGVINAYRQTGEAPSIEDFRAGLPNITWTYTEEA